MTEATQKHKYPVRADLMARVLREAAEKIAREPGETKMSADNGVRWSISNTETARRLLLQADRWERETITGEPNIVDRERMGMPP